MNDEVRRLILARRARFIAAALAGAGVAAPGCGGEADCAETAAQSPRHSAQAEPSDSSLGEDASAGADASDAEPQICLSIRIDKDSGCP